MHFYLDLSKPKNSIKQILEYIKKKKKQQKCSIV
jgi:hypothetical protein